MKRLIVIALVVAGAGQLAAFAQVPPVQWAVQPGETGGVVDGVALDPAGNLLVAGEISPLATFGSITLDTNSGFGFLAEYTLGGAPLKAISLPETTLFPGEHFLNAITVDGAGHIYMAGGDGGIALAKYDADWNLDWVTNSTAGGGQARALAMDPDGNCYITGYFNGYVSLGNATLTGPDSDDVLIAKFDPNGNCLWAQSLPADGGFGNAGYAVAVDSSTNVFVSGALNGDAFVAKFDQNGNNVWLEQAGGTGGSGCTGIAADQSGNVYVTGNGNGGITLGAVSLSTAFGDVFVAKFDGEGNLLWAIQDQESSSAGVAKGFNGVCTDRDGNCCVTGCFASVAKFGSTTLTSPGSNALDAFVAKVDSNGNWLWATSAGGGTNDYGSWCFAIAADQFGNLYVAGRVAAPAQFGGNTLENSGIFVARIDAINPPTLSIAQTAGGVILSWPTNQPDFTLQSTTNLAPPVNWVDSARPPGIRGGQYTVTNRISATAQFFRLTE